MSDSPGHKIKIDSKSDAEATIPSTIQFGLKLSQMGLSLSSPNLRTATSLFSSSDSDESSANESGDKTKNVMTTTNNIGDDRPEEFTLIDGHDETISGENDVEYAEFSIHQVPQPTNTNGIDETATLNEELMFLKLFDELQPQGAEAANDNKNFPMSSKFSRTSSIGNYDHFHVNIKHHSASRSYQSPNVLESLALLEPPKRKIRPLESSLITNINFKNSIESNRLNDGKRVDEMFDRNVQS